jgi:methyl-accepting chemotaxis protein
MGLRSKILSGFIILSVMLLVAGLWSIYQLNLIGTTVQDILDENYSSIQAAKHMTESIEREDSGILLLMLGKWEEGRKILGTADSNFYHHFEFAYNNITIPDEKIYLDSIKSSYEEFKKLWERPIVGTIKEGDFNWYFVDVRAHFNSLKESINSLISLNADNMYNTASNLGSKSKASIMPGIVAVISSLLFTLIFTYLINHFFISPIIRMTDKIQQFIDKKVPFRLEIETNDELKELEDSINLLCEYRDMEATNK